MTYADNIFKENIKNILNNGVMSQQARPQYVLNTKTAQPPIQNM